MQSNAETATAVFGQPIVNTSLTLTPIRGRLPFRPSKRGVYRNLQE
jgi:hypothetical protein